MSKAQITLFIALGIIFIGIIGIALTLQSTMVDDIQNDVLREAQQHTQLVDSTNRFVSACLYDLAVESIELIGQQGGVLYESQGGVFDDDAFFMQFREGEHLYPVAYGIKESSSQPLPPAYPYQITYSVRRLQEDFPTSAFYGKVSLPPLCSHSGPNARTNNAFIPCPSDAYGLGDNVIQREITNYIHNGLYECIDNQLEVFNLERNNELAVDVIFGQKEVVVQADMKIIIDDDTTLDNFSVNVPIRLKRIYELTKRILEQDVLNISFDKTVAYRDLGTCQSYFGSNSCLLDGMKVSVLRDVQGHNDLLRIVDESSVSSSGAYVFQVAIQNRRPVLDFMPLVRVVGVGENVIFVPSGYDPDEDSLTYSYTNEWIDLSLPNLMESNFYTTQSLCGGAFVKEKCANIAFTALTTDLLPEIELSNDATVKVQDSSGLNDFQPVKIYVR